MCQVLSTFIILISSYLHLRFNPKKRKKEKKKPNHFLKASRSFSIHFTNACQLPFEQQLDISPP